MASSAARDDILTRLDALMGQLLREPGSFAVKHLLQQAIQATDELCQVGPEEASSSVRYVVLAVEELAEGFLMRQRANVGSVQRVRREVARCRGERSSRRINVVFFPYQAAMWDSFATIWSACLEMEDVEPYVVPVPFSELGEDGNPLAWRSEASCFPEAVATLSADAFFKSALEVDIGLIHNPYDSYNRVTRVDSRFFSESLMQSCDVLCYVPYWVSTSEDIPERLVNVPGVLHADIVAVQSEGMKSQYAKWLTAGCGGKVRAWEDKCKVTGSPKFDRVVAIPDESGHGGHSSSVVSGQGVSRSLLVVTSIADLLMGRHDLYLALLNVLRLVDVLDWLSVTWRPHPLAEATLNSMVPELRSVHDAVVHLFRQHPRAVMDESADWLPVVAHADAYYGANSSLMSLFSLTGRPAMHMNPAVHGVRSWVEPRWWDMKFHGDGLTVLGGDNVLAWVPLDGSPPEVRALLGDSFRSDIRGAYAGFAQEGDLVALPPWRVKDFRILTGGEVLNSSSIPEGNAERGREGFEDQYFAACFSLGSGQFMALPWNYDAIVLFGPDGVLDEDRSWTADVPPKECDSGIGWFSRCQALVDGVGFFASQRSNVVLKKAGCEPARVWYRGAVGERFCGSAYSGGYLWVAPLVSGRLVKLNESGLVVGEVSAARLGIDEGRGGFQHVFPWGEGVVLLPGSSADALCVSADMSVSPWAPWAHVRSLASDGDAPMISAACAALGQVALQVRGRSQIIRVVGSEDSARVELIGGGWEGAALEECLVRAKSVGRSLPTLVSPDVEASRTVVQMSHIEGGVDSLEVFLRALVPPGNGAVDVQVTRRRRRKAMELLNVSDSRAGERVLSACLARVEELRSAASK